MKVIADNTTRVALPCLPMGTFVFEIPLIFQKILAMRLRQSSNLHGQISILYR
jgi:hypothetical protein